MTNKECLNRIAKLTDELKIADVTKEEYLEAIKDASFNDISDEMWAYYCYICDIKSVLMEVDNQIDYENRLKADMIAMLSELKYDLYQELCKEIHGKEDCPCTNQTTSCLATFRVCDANSAIDRTIQQKINALKED